MARPGRSANSYTHAAVVLLLTLVASCGERGQHAGRVVAVNDPKLRETNETVFYGGERFGGVVFALGAMGDTIYRAVYHNGVKDGTTQQWFGDHTLRESRDYANGKRVGIHEGWWPNGRLRFRYHYANDLMDGIAEEWYVTGQPYRSMHYREGYESGLQRLWNADGSLFANYIVKDGRQYGLTGVTNCVNYLRDSTTKIALGTGASHEK